jgi:hypothetical protein
MIKAIRRSCGEAMRLVAGFLAAPPAGPGAWLSVDTKLAAVAAERMYGMSCMVITLAFLASDARGLQLKSQDRILSEIG